MAVLRIRELDLNRGISRDFWINDLEDVPKFGAFRLNLYSKFTSWS